MAALRSWIPSANDASTDFPIDNLPLGVFRRRRASHDRPAIGAAIGHHILNVGAAAQAGLLAAVSAEIREALGEPSLDALMTLGRRGGAEVRHALADLLQDDGAGAATRERAASPFLVAAADADLLLPCRIGDFTDFYASFHHALNVGRLLRPEQPLPANFHSLPLAYHGRASSIVPSGTPIVRPAGQVKTASGLPVFQPTAALDFEMEIGFLVGDTNPIGVPVTIADAESRLFGAVLVNDWSARDIQAWESQPLGPFLSKNFATTISPWVVLMDALDPYRTSPRQRGVNDPPLLEYLTSGDNERRGAIDLTIQAALTSVHMRARGFPEVTLGRAAFRHHYWTPAQMVAHHGSNGCRLRPGDLIGSGTVSGEGPDARGCLLELTERGRRQLALPTGEQRTYLSDGDEVVLRASAERHDRPRIGFGECRGQILPATPNTSTRALSPSRP